MPTLAELRRRLPELTLRDEHRLRRRLDGVRTSGDRDAALARLAEDVARAQGRVERRRSAVPRVSYPPQLPVSERRDDLAAAIREHQVVIVAGETGSGKTTQLPKICLELGRGVRGLIGHTQPRRIAARTVAERIAEELGTPVGAAVGWKVRFTDAVGEDTLVKVMTDGILLAELAADRALRAYDTLIIDEAHERSLNIDFILGYVKALLPRRPDLKVIVTSATIDTGRFSRHFGDAPVVEVSGRTYPVDVRYRPVVEDDSERDQTQALCDAVEELSAEGPGDILAFLSGEREIRDTADALARLDLRDTEILPLYARLSSAEQHRVFQPHPGRRIVLATNVAETSVTVPGIRYVVDPGTARISRYSHRRKVQRLPIEPISRASANQRAGRCGRVAAGTCIRLYSEEDFAGRPEFTDPEILRTNLAAVILQMTALDLGDIAAFPFVEPPDRRNVKAGVELLAELGAIRADETDACPRLTPMGRKLAQLPIDPRLARMVLAAGDHGCVREVMIIVAALSIQDPRERPAERQGAADQKHARFADKTSDFLAYVNLWRYLREQQKSLSSNQFRRLCKAEFLNYLRVREWQDIASQLRQAAKSVGLSLNTTPAESQAIHTALLAGLLSHIGLQDPEKREFGGASGARFAIFPGSALFKRPPRWVMAAELVETTRLWARVVAKIEPEWVEPLAEHLVKRNYSGPHWERNQAAVMAYEKVTLYGVPIVASRKVNYGRIEPELCRELFIRHALVEGDWQTHHRFFHENRELLAEVEELEDRARRRDILVDEDTLFDFYDRRVPAEVVSGRHFDSWWKNARRSEPDLLTFEKSMLINADSGTVSEADYPDAWQQGGLRLPLTYQFEPGAAADGVTVHIPLAMLSQVDGAEFEWQIPGMREQLVTALLRSLPKPLRRSVVPVPDYARAVLARLHPRTEPLLPALQRELRDLAGVHVPPDAWVPDRVPDHLLMTFRVEDADGFLAAEGKDLAALKVRLTPRVRETLSVAGHDIERTGLRGWDFGALPRTYRVSRDGYDLTAYPALVDEGDSVAVRLLDTEPAQRRAMWQGTRRLLLLAVPSPEKYVQGRLGNAAMLTLRRNPDGGLAELLADCVACSVDAIVGAVGGPAWDGEDFARLRDRVRIDLPSIALDTVERVRQVLAAAHELELRPDSTPAAADVRRQLARLVHRGFVTAAGRERLPDLLRYVQAAARRLDKASEDPARDADLQARIEDVTGAYRELLAAVPPGQAAGEALLQVRWMIEELRVSYFAQALGTPYPVSEKRIHRALADASAVSLS